MIILNKNVRKTFVNDPLHPQYFDYFCSVAPIQTRVSNFSTMDDGAVKAQVLILFWALYHQYPAWKHAGGKKLWLRRFPICRKVCFQTKRPTLYRESWARCTGVRWVYQTVMSGAENRERVCCMRVFNLIISCSFQFEDKGAIFLRSSRNQQKKRKVKRKASEGSIEPLRGKPSYKKSFLCVSSSASSILSIVIW